MALDINVSPYFDDSADAIAKKFSKILFKPGVAVQARELTQLQSLLQNQIEKFGNHVFKNGTVITGCPFQLDTSRDFAKIKDADASGITITDLSSYVGCKLVGQTTSIQAEILNVITGDEGSAPDYNTIYLRYLTGDGETQNSFFRRGEILLVVASETESLIGDTFVVAEDDAVIGKGSFVTVGSGVVYMDGKFVEFTQTTLPLDKYGTLPSYKVGFELNETIVDSEADNTLLDPARGSFNYSAPGADRYVATPVLRKYAYTVQAPEDFRLYLEIRRGQIYTTQTEDKIYSVIGKNLAKRTYDESGNYTVKAFPIRLREHLDDGSNGGYLPYNPEYPEYGGNEEFLAVGIEPGKAYVHGYAVETATTQYIPILKGIDSRIDDGAVVATAYGSYILVDDMCGNWDVAAGDTVQLRDAAANAVSSGSYSAHAAAGNKIGTARVRYIKHESGTIGSAAAQYRMYLYDISMDASKNFDNVKSVFYNTTADGHADVVLENSIAVLKETKFNKLLFRLPTKATKTLKPGINQNNDFDYTKQFSASISSSTNDVVVSVSGYESFPYTIGTLSASEIADNLFLSLTQAATINSVSYAAGTILNLNGSGFVVTNTGTQLTISLPGTSGATAAIVQVLAKVRATNVEPVRKVLKENAVIVINTNTGNANGTYSLGVSDGWKLKHVYIGAYDDTAEDVVSAGDDVADQFIFDNGQRDNFYANCRIVKKAASSLSLTNSKLVVVFDYFEHNGDPVTNYNFYCVDSYPVDDTGATEATIHTYEIPVYTSQVTGEVFDLRDTLDFRPRFDNTITYTTSATSAEGIAANVNPSSGLTPSGPQGGAVITPVPTEQFTTDLEYYMGRKDRVIVDGEGNFSVVSGVSSLYPIEAVEPDNAMSLALITIPPYPSLAPNIAKSISRPSMGVTMKLVDNRRYTMRDIGVIEQRINRLEYYSALSLLEKSAKDMVIPSAVDATLDRFKSGILVDAFTGHNIGNVKSSEYHCAIDPDNKELRPFFFLENVDLHYNSTNSSNMVKTGDLLTLPYTSVAYASNPYAVKPRNCVGDLLFNYLGDMQLDPPVDNWVDTNTLPDITANFDGNYDAWENLADAWGTQWGSWQDVGTGKVISTETTNAVSSISTGGNTGFTTDLQLVTTTTEQRQTRQGVQVSVTPETQTQRTGARVTNTSIVPFMRTITVKFSATRLKPRTRVYPFFDKIAVAEHCRPLPVGAINTTSPTNSDFATWRDYSAFGDALITDDQGRLCGEFRIPAGQFRVGDKIFRLCDDVGNRPAFTTTAATQTFSANGLAQNVQDTILSTRVAKVYTSTVEDSRSVYDTQTTVNRLEGRTVGIVNTTINNTYTTENNTYVTNTVNNTTVVNPVTTVIVTEPPATTTTTTTTAAPTTTTTTTTAEPTTTTTTTTTTTAAPTTTTTTTTTEEPTTTPAPPIPETQPPANEFCFWQNDFGGSWWDPWSGIWGVEWWRDGWGWAPQEWVCVQASIPRVDPIAQTFTVDNMPFGMYATAIDVYFRTKSQVSPITLQLREVVNGYPSNTILPFGEVTLQPSQVNVDSENGQARTTFVFPSPVYLKNNTEYCYALLPAGNDPGYEVWVSELGENIVNTTTRVSENPSVGVLFTSSNNNTWNALQAEDMKFTLYRANFEIGTVALAEFETKDMDYLKFDQFSGSPFEVSNVIHSFTFNITSGGGSYTNGTYSLSLSGGGATTNAQVSVVVSGGNITSITVTDPGTGYTSNPTISFSSIPTTGSHGSATVVLNAGYIQSYDTLYNVAKVYVEKGHFVANSVVGNGTSYAEIMEIEDKLINSLTANIGYITHTPCQLIWSYSATTNAGDETSANDEFVNFIPDKPEELRFDASIRSYSNEEENLNGEKSFKIRAGMATQTSTVSPVIDLRKCSMIVTANDVNNSAEDEDTSVGEALSKYVSRRVVLEDGQEAEDLRVYLSNSLPAGTDVQVYAKMQHEADPESFDDKPWVLMDTVTPAALAPTGYAEYTYNLPTDVLNGDGIYEYVDNDVTYVGYKIFAIKVVMLSTKKCVVPKVRELRAIALQV